MDNLPLCILLVVLAFVIFVYAVRENFSDSDVVLPNDECRRMTGYYYKPTIADPAQRAEFIKKMCGDNQTIMIDKPDNFYKQWASIPMTQNQF